MSTRSLQPIVSLGAVLLLLPSLTVGCSGADEEPGGGSGGDVGTGGTDAGSGGASGGSASGGGIGDATGGSASGGGPGTGGSASGGGPAAGGSGSGGDGAGGDGSGGDGSGGGAAVSVDPSPGCSAGAQSFTVQNGKVSYPDGYDGSTPVPVLFAFHGAGGNEDSLLNQWNNTPIRDKYMMISLKSTDSGWGLNADRPRVEAAYDAMEQNGCVDMNRIFAVGHSSGAQMIVQLLCGGYSDFDAVVPVASSVYCSGWDPVPVLSFHGLDDQERCAYGLDDCDGRKDIVPYYTSNECEDVRQPADLDVGSSCAGNINPGCVEFQGCSEPTFFCNHNDPQYGTSNHGIPCFATPAMMDFLGRFDP